MVEVTLEITQDCPNYCDYCSSNAVPNGKDISFNEVEEFFKGISQPIERINISGGEPLSHPDFYKILRLCESITQNVWVYTNALKQIIYNAHVLKEIKIEANIVVIQGREHYIPKNVDKVHLLRLIHQGRAKEFPKQDISVSRNFWDKNYCEECNHFLLQADGQVVKAPCKKSYN